MTGRFRFAYALALWVPCLALLCSCGPIAIFGTASLILDDDSSDDLLDAIPLEAPDAPFPPDDAEHTPISVTLSWQAPPDAVRFEIAIGRDVLPPEPQASVETNRLEVGPLAFDATYSWNVIAYGDDGRQTASSTWTFTTIVERAPEIVLPANGLITLRPGQTGTMSIEVVDPHDRVTLTAKDLPAGAEWEDAPNLEEAPITRTLTWTPDPGSVGLHIVRLRSRDAASASSGLVRLMIQVVDPLPYPFDIQDLAAEDGFRFVGGFSRGRAGWSVSGLGDIDGDGHMDLGIGAPDWTNDRGIRAGAVFVVFGGSLTSSDTAIPLENLGERGLHLIGDDNGDQAGWAVSGVGDVDGDGYADFAIGAPGARRGAGVTYLVFGGSVNPAQDSIKLETLPPASIVKLIGDRIDDASGFDVRGAGDINGDGYPDIVIGAPRSDPFGLNRAGRVYVVFGGPEVGKEGALELRRLDGSDGFRVDGVQVESLTGHSVTGCGDTDGDGFDDFLIGAPFTDSDDHVNAGLTYLIHGDPDLGKAGLLDLSRFSDPLIVRLNGRGRDEESGFSVCAAGDVNGDGLHDFALGAPRARDDQQREVGATDLVRGASALGIQGEFDLADLDGLNGYRALGAPEGSRAGSSVASAGDLDGDGRSDLLIGAPDVNSLFDGTYALYGSFDVIEPSIALGDVDESTGTFFFDRSLSTTCGWSVRTAGDVDADGWDDVLIGAPDAQGRLGVASLLRGHPWSFVSQATVLSPPGNPTEQPVGVSGDGLLDDSPSTGVWIKWRGGADASRTDVTLLRSAEGLEALPEDIREDRIVARQWTITSDREFSSARLTFFYTDSSLGDADESVLRAFHAPKPDGPWKELAIRVRSPERNRLTIETESLGSFILAE